MGYKKYRPKTRSLFLFILFSMFLIVLVCLVFCLQSICEFRMLQIFGIIRSSRNANVCVSIFHNFVYKALNLHLSTSRSLSTRILRQTRQTELKILCLVIVLPPDISTLSIRIQVFPRIVGQTNDRVER